MKNKRKRLPVGATHSAPTKLVEQSVALSFGPSAGGYCDTVCKLWKTCYAARNETRYKHLAAKLESHHNMGPIATLDLAHAELQSWIVKDPEYSLLWGRLAPNGSLPSKQELGDNWPVWSHKLRDYVRHGIELGATWHIPIESYAKCRSYRAMFRDMPEVVIRRTCQSTWTRCLASTDPRSYVVGTPHRGPVKAFELARNRELCYSHAKQARARGISCVVCSSICGQCTACGATQLGMHAVDLILFPFHG